MKITAYTNARRRFGAVLDAASRDMVVVSQRGKAPVVALPADEAQIAVLCSYAQGAMSKTRAMRRLGFRRAEQLTLAMAEHNLRVKVPARRPKSMPTSVGQGQLQ